MFRTIGLLCALTCASAQAVADITISPSPSVDGNYTVSWTPHWMADDRYDLYEQSSSGVWRVYQLWPRTTSKTFTGKTVGSYTYTLSVCKRMDDPDELDCFDSRYVPATVVVSPDIPEAPGYDEQEDYRYRLHQGDFDNNGSVDFYVRQEVGGTPGNGALESFFLVQGAAGQFSATPGNDALRGIAASWPELALPLDRYDVNADGFLDIVVRDLGQVVSGADDQIVFASGEIFNAAPRGVRAIDAGVELFVANAMNYLADSNYFRVNVPVETVTRIEWEYECEFYWYGQTPEWRCDWYPVVVEEEVLDTSGFSDAAIDLWQRYERFESGEGSAEAIAEVLETLLGVIIGGVDLCDTDDSLLPVEVQCRLFASTAAAVALATATGHASTSAGRQPNVVYVTGHRVSFTFADHLALEFTPPNFSNPPTFTISAGAIPPHGLGDAKLVSESRRATDRPEFNRTIGVVTGGTGTSAVLPLQYWSEMVIADQNYCDGLDYDPHPELFGGTGYNSNGFIAGIVQATGGVTAVDFTRFVGGSTPVPAVEFSSNPPCGN